MKIVNLPIVFLLLFAIGCKKQDDTTFGSKDITKIALANETLEMMEGDTVTLDIIFNSRLTAEKYTDFSWHVEDSKIASVSANGVSVPVVALSEGTTNVVVESADKQLVARREINVSKAKVLLNRVLLDFGPVPSGKPFNLINDFRKNKLTNLKDDHDIETGIDMEIVSDFEGQNDLGVANNALGLPAQVSTDAFYGSINNSEAEIKLSKLNRNKYYNLSFYGARRDVADNRETAYKVVARDRAQTVYHNASNNSSVMSSVTNLRPTKDGEISIIITFGPNNNNGSKFFYLNAMMIEPAD